MWKHLVALAALTLAAACGTSDPKTYTGAFTRPPAQSRILVMTPDVQLALLTTAGLPEPRADWSNAGRDNLLTSVRTHVEGRGFTFQTLDPSTAMQGRIGQLIRLHSAVGQSILLVNYMHTPLPTKANTFEWTLGPGVSELSTAHSADYALFITGQGSYASAGRVAVSLGLAFIGVVIPVGEQQAFASLVDLHTGNVIWFNVVTPGTGEDMRSPEGAERLTRRLMTEAPL